MSCQGALRVRGQAVTGFGTLYRHLWRSLAAGVFFLCLPDLSLPCVPAACNLARRCSLRLAFFACDLCRLFPPVLSLSALRLHSVVQIHTAGPRVSFSSSLLLHSAQNHPVVFTIPSCPSVPVRRAEGNHVSWSVRKASGDVVVDLVCYAVRRPGCPTCCLPRPVRLILVLGAWHPSLFRCWGRAFWLN